VDSPVVVDSVEDTRVTLSVVGEAEE